MTSNHKISSRVAVMILFFRFILTSLSLILLLKFASINLSERSQLIREELSSYECGFEHHNVSRIPISLRYFMLTLLFLLFDLEVVFLLFLPYLCTSSVILPSVITRCLFSFFLLATLIYEWKDGTLE